MTLCPVAIAITCNKCPVVNFCPGKSIIGDYKPEQKGQAPETSAPKYIQPGDTN